jgi:hypothetical protein
MIDVIGGGKMHLGINITIDQRCTWFHKRIHICDAKEKTIGFVSGKEMDTVFFSYGSSLNFFNCSTRGYQMTAHCQNFNVGVI